jgi:hypothetical protein
MTNRTLRPNIAIYVLPLKDYTCAEVVMCMNVKRMEGQNAKIRHRSIFATVTPRRTITLGNFQIGPCAPTFPSRTYLC